MFSRLMLLNVGDDVLYVCLFDIGVNYGYLLFEIVFDDVDFYSVEFVWGVGDGDGYGIGMVGLVIVGDLIV